MVLREANDPLNQSRGIMNALGNTVESNRGRLRQRFDLIRKLGQGTYGKVQLGIDKETGQEVAIKTIKKSKIETEADLIRIRREIQIMSSVRHPNIIHIYEVFENREKMVLVMEYAAGGELYDYLNERKILQEDEARRIFRQIASAVYYCHKHKICHRDLKLENILLDEKSNAKIADFGLSNVFDDINLLKTFCGSPLYASPEIVCGSPYNGPEVDCWSLGVLLYTLVYGSMPFDGGNFKRLVKQISNGDYYEPKKPAEASSLIKRMLTVDPVKRATIKDVCSHQWINHGFDKPCLNNAEELANQTPVRLDLLLSLAPAYNINHSQVVIACDQTQDEAGATAAPAATSGPDASHHPSASKQPSSSKGGKEKERIATIPPFEKPVRTSLLNKDKVPIPTDSQPVKAPAATKDSLVKKKPAVKKKSKSSPLLELIVDVEEENDNEPLEIINGAAGGDDDDDAGDTLSEISEIQTIAEDIKEVNKSRSKVKVKEKEERPATVEQKPVIVKEEKKKEKESSKPVVVQVKEKVKNEESKEKPNEIEKEKEKEKVKEKEKIVEEAGKVPLKQNAISTTAATTTSTAVAPEKEKPKTENEVKIKTKTTKVAAKDEPLPPSKVPENDNKGEKKSETQQQATESAAVLSKDESTPVNKTTENESATASASASVPKKPPTVVKKKVVKKVVKASPPATAEDSDKGGKSSLVNTESSSSVASSAGGKASGSKLDKDGSSSSARGSVGPKLRARSDSNASSSDASPTRIERRSSKIISQKTAELIQNLETKTSTSSTDSGKAKKLVFPSLTKVSDAKRAFEKPPKPVISTTGATSTKPTQSLKTTSSGPTVKSTSSEKEKDVKPVVDKEEVVEQQLTVSKPKKSKSKSPSPCVDDQKIVKKEESEKEPTEIAKIPSTTTTTATTKKSPKVERKSDAETPKPEKSVTNDKTEQTPQPLPAQTKTTKESTKPSLEVNQSPTLAKQKSPSPKPEKKKVAATKEEEKEKVIPISVVYDDAQASTLPISPEPDTQTISDDLNTEIDTVVSEISEVPSQKKAGANKPLKKLKIVTQGNQSQANSDQLVKPVLVDSGNGPTKQVMLVHGKTTPPVKMSAEIDSTDPFFSQSESVSVSPPQDKPSTVKTPSTPNKEQAVKKISSVISRIASSESTDRILNEDGGNKTKTVNKTPNKLVKTEVSFPVAAAQSQERIIPIKFSDDVPQSPQATAHHQLQQGNTPLASSSKTQSAPNISRIPPRKVDGSSSSIFSRQNSSDTESSLAAPCKPEPIRKSPREFIIPIKIEHSGQTVTPKDDISEASNAEDPFRMDSRLRSGRFGRHKRYSSLLSDSSLEEEPVSVSASTSRRSSTATNTSVPTHTRSHSQGDEPDTPQTPLGTFKRYRMRRSGIPLDRSDSFSSAEEEDEEDNFEVLTAESLFSNLLDRVRNLTKRLNRDEGPTNWPGSESPGFGLWGNGNPLREFMSRAPSETRSFVSSGPPGSYTMTRSFSREPSVTVTVTHGPGWRRSLSRELSGDSEYSEPQSAASAPRSGSIFQSRGGLGYHNHSGSVGDQGDTCTVRSLPLNLGSSTTRRSSFMSQRSCEPDSSLSMSSSASSSQFGNPLISSQTSIANNNILNPSVPNNHPTARQLQPYNRTMSNNEYSSSVTLPFRRSLKSYDRPSFALQNDYSSSTSSPSSSHLNHVNNLNNHHTPSASDHFLGSSNNNPNISSSLHSHSHHQYGGLPHRSNSVIGPRYGANSTNIPSTVGGDSPLNNCSSSSPYSSRYSRSLSRVRSTPEPDIQRFRDSPRDVPSRQFESQHVSSHNTNTCLNNNHSNDHGNCNSTTNNPSSANNASLTLSGEMQGGSVFVDDEQQQKTPSRMSTQEKMNNYQNYYHSLSQNPMRRFNTPQSPALANYCDEISTTTTTTNNNNNPHNNNILSQSCYVNGSNSHSHRNDEDYNALYNQRASVDRVLPQHQPPLNSVKTFRYDQQQQLQQQATPGVTTSTTGVNFPKKSISGIQRATRELSSPPMINNTNNNNNNSGNNINNFVDSSSPISPTSSSGWNTKQNNNNSNNSIPKWPNISIKTHRPVNVTNFVDPSVSSGINNNNSNNAPRMVRITSPPPQPYMSSVKNYTSQTSTANPSLSSSSVKASAENPSTAEIAPNSSTATYPSQKVPPPKRDARATSVEKITRFLERKSVPRVVSPPPLSLSPPPASISSGDTSMTMSLCSSPVNNPNPTSQSSSTVSVINNGPVQFDDESNNIAQSGSGSDVNVNRSSCNSSPDKLYKSSFGGGGGGQKITKPNFIKSLEKKWEKISGGGGNSGNASKSSAGNTDDNVNAHAAKSLDNSKDVNNSSSDVLSGCDEDDDSNMMMTCSSQTKLDSESRLLQRAVSPEKKPKKGFLGNSSTVNFMLGKFRKIEESGSGIKDPSASKIPGKPPLGGSTSNTRIGRRVQSVYAGASSDSVLTLTNNNNTPSAFSNNQPQVSKNIGFRKPLTVHIANNNNPISTPSTSTLATGHGHGNGVAVDKEKDKNPNASLLVIKNNSNTDVSDANNEGATATVTQNQSEEPSNKTPKTNKLRRPLSLGIFSNSNNNPGTPSSSVATATTTATPSSSSSSFIPRFSKQNVAAVSAAAEKANSSNVNSCSVKSPEVVMSLTTKTTTAATTSSGKINCPATSRGTTPQIQITSDRSNAAELPSSTDEPLTPTSISDSFDSSSVCSEKTEQSVRSVLDDEESVSDRILRKSYYQRFNSLDRKNRSSSVSSSSPRIGGASGAGLSGSGSSPTAGSRKIVSRSSISPSSSNNHPLGSPNSNSNIMTSSFSGTSSNYSGVGGSGSSNSNSLYSDNLMMNSSGASSKINKYNPNPLFKELITDDWDVGRKSKAEYSRRVTSKLSKLLREIESDIGNSSNNDGAPSFSPRESSHYGSNHTTRDRESSQRESIGRNYLGSTVRNRESLSPSPGRMMLSQSSTATQQRDLFPNNNSNNPNTNNANPSRSDMNSS